MINSEVFIIKRDSFACIITIELSESISICVAVSKELIIVQASIIGRDTIEAAKVDSLCALLIGKKCFACLGAIK